MRKKGCVADMRAEQYGGSLMLKHFLTQGHCHDWGFNDLFCLQQKEQAKADN